jgi:hypothetical protein
MSPNSYLHSLHAPARLARASMDRILFLLAVLVIVSTALLSIPGHKPSLAALPDPTSQAR